MEVANEGENYFVRGGYADCPSRYAAKQSKFLEQPKRNGVGGGRDRHLL